MASNDEQEQLRQHARVLVQAFLEPSKFYWIGVGFLMAAFGTWREDSSPVDLAIVGAAFMGLALALVLLHRWYPGLFHWPR